MIGAEVGGSFARRGALAQLADVVGDALHELVVDRRLDVHALDRDADLAGVVHRVVGGGVGRPLDIGVGAHDQRVLAAELEVARDQPLGGRLEDRFAGLGRAGEHDAIDRLDQRRAGRPVAGCDLKRPVGQPGLAHHLRHQQRAQRRHLAGLEDHAVAGRQRRDAVTERIGDRKVPRADHAHDADRRVAHRQLLPEGQRVGPRPNALARQIRRRAPGPEAERAHGVAEVGELRVLVGLAGLGHDGLDHPLGVIEHPLLRAPQHLRAPLEPECLPAGLSRAGQRGHFLDLVAPEYRDRADELAGGGVLDADHLVSVSAGRRRRFSLCGFHHRGSCLVPWMCLLIGPRDRPPRQG